MTLLHTTELMAGYGQSIVLHGVSFDMKAHEAVAVVGKNGASLHETGQDFDGLPNTLTWT